MKRITIIFLITLFLLISCSPVKKPIKQELIENPYTFQTKLQGDISIMPSYKYVGSKDFSDEKAKRSYYVWIDRNQNKYIMIYQLIVNKGKFPSDIQWINNDYAIYSDGMRAAFTSLGKRPYETLKSLNIELPECYILGEEVHVSETNDECIIRILIVPDDLCAENYEPVMEELDRVAIINPLG